MAWLAGEKITADRLNQPQPLFQLASGDLTIPQNATTPTDIPGATITFTTLRADAAARVRAAFDWNLTATGTGFCYGVLVVDGVVQTGPAIFTAQSVETRFSGYQQWNLILPTAGSHTIKIGGRKDSSTGTAFFRGAATSLSIDLFD